MTMKIFSLTLSRWHAVGERLQAKATELSTQALHVLSHTQATSYQNQESILREDASAALGKIERCRKILHHVGHIRAALGRVNQERGVTEALARQQVLNREIQLLRQLATVDVSQKVSIDNLQETFAKRVGQNLAVYERAVAVAMLSRDEIKDFQAELDALQAKAYALSDSINDLNRHKLDIELDEEVAGLVGL